MALKVDYVTRETLTNLRRNLTLTFASVVTVAVSLALVGSSLVVRQAVNHSTQRWRGNVQFIVFMRPDATNSQIQAVGRALRNNKNVKKATFFNHRQAYNEFKDLNSHDPTIVSVVSAKDLPTSWRVSPRIKDADAINQLGKSYQHDSGVLRVIFAYDAVKTVQRVSHVISTVILIVAIILLVAAILLILNTIRMAMFARRREIEVMKLVGATNWFIQIPFMLEGLLQGLVGSIPAVIAVVVLHLQLDSSQGAGSVSNNNLFAGLTVSGSETLIVSLILVAIGAVVGFVGSYFAVRRFLNV